MTNTLIQRGDIGVRLMQDDMSDYQLMAQWLSDERVLEFYEGRDNPFPLERIITQYSPRVLGVERVTPCIIVYRAQPIGYAQYYSIAAEEQREYGLTESEEAANVFGLDLFIGEAQYWNQGLGTQAVAALLAYLFDELQARMVMIDPEAWNTRAIRCYEKCGFRKVKLLPQHELHEGEYRDSWLMVISHEEYARTSRMA